MVNIKDQRGHLVSRGEGSGPKGTRGTPSVQGGRDQDQRGLGGHLGSRGEGSGPKGTRGTPRVQGARE